MTPTDPFFRWDGHYWGFRVGDRLYDRYGRQVAWFQPTPPGTPRWHGRTGEAPRPAGEDVYALDGHFLGELCDGRHVLRHAGRADPVPRAARAPVPYGTPPDPVPDRGPRDPVDDWRDVLPWPLRPPTPIRV
jgi:hypothetical protein